MKKIKMINNLVEKLKQIYKEKLVSVILYGSCAFDEHDNKFSDINTIVVIDNLLAMDLKNANSALKYFMKTKNPLPLFMDKEEWFNSCDVYPIEYSDIKDRYKILYGEDIVKPLILEKTNLRLQCEHETKNLLIKLRQNYLAKSNDLKAIELLLKTSSKSFFALFRAILRLTGSNVSFDHKEAINSLAEKVKIDKDVFLTLLDFRTNSRVISKKEYEITIQKLIDSTDEILKYIDKM
jgi:predicted nucleotidyltransferase